MSRIWGLLGILGISMFCGLIMIAIAAGAVVPKLIEPIAAPVVCPHGQLVITQNTTSYRQGESDTWTTDTCVDAASSQQQDVSMQTTFAAGMIYSLIIFVVILAWQGYKKLSTGMKAA